MIKRVSFYEMPCSFVVMMKVVYPGKRGITLTTISAIHINGKGRRQNKKTPILNKKHQNGLECTILRRGKKQFCKIYFYV